MTELIPLGINGFFPYNGRQTACYLIIKEDTVIILDAGTGISRLLSEKIKEIIKDKEINIILSHYHLDHICGLSYLTGLQLNTKVKLYCPIYPMVKTKNIKALKTLLSMPLFSLSFKNLPIKEVIEIKNDNFKINDINIELINQHHPNGSIGIKINNEIAYITDTIISDKTADFVKNIQLLLHEIWIVKDEQKLIRKESNGIHPSKKHSYETGVIKIIKKSQCKQFMPIHIPPWHSQQDITKLINRIRENEINTIHTKELKRIII